jgi:hypothetical protein
VVRLDTCRSSCHSYSYGNKGVCSTRFIPYGIFNGPRRLDAISCATQVQSLRPDQSSSQTDADAPKRLKMILLTERARICGRKAEGNSAGPNSYSQCEKDAVRKGSGRNAMRPEPIIIVVAVILIPLPPTTERSQPRSRCSHSGPIQALCCALL